jgi:16S rRNA processing protein RimM
MGAFGPRGDVRVQPFSDKPGRFQSIKRVFVGPELLPARILGRGENGLGVTLRLDIVTTREHAKRLFGTLLYVPETEAVALPPGEYFVHQLIGSSVVTDTGESLGTIAEILRTGSNDVYVVRGDRGEVLIPVIPDVVQGVDVERRVVTVTLMPGLVD